MPVFLALCRGDTEGKIRPVIHRAILLGLPVPQSHGFTPSAADATAHQRSPILDESAVAFPSENSAPLKKKIRIVGRIALDSFLQSC